MVEKAIRAFQREIEHKVESRYLPAGHRFHLGPQHGPLTGTGHRFDLGPQHAPLTGTERSRFTRSYYQLWGFMELGDCAELKTRLQSLTMKQLLHLRGIAHDESISLPQCMIFDSGLHRSFPNSSEDLEYRKCLLNETSRNELDRRGYGTNVTNLVDLMHAYGDSHWGYSMIWDDYQAAIKHVVCTKSAHKQLSETETHWEQWEDSSDEDV